MTTSPSTCNIRKSATGWHWVGRAQCNCVMAIAKGDEIYGNDLRGFLASKEITRKEFNSITRFDNWEGTYEDKKVIEKLASKLNVVIEVRVF